MCLLLYAHPCIGQICSKKENADDEKIDVEKFQTFEVGIAASIFANVIHVALVLPGTNTCFDACCVAAYSKVPNCRRVPNKRRDFRFLVGK